MADEETKSVKEEEAASAEAEEQAQAAAAIDAETGAATESTASARAEPKTDEVSDLLRQLDEVTAEANRHRGEYLRSVADLENYRKRALREKEEARQRAEAAVLMDCLPVLDNLRLGLQAAQQHESGKVFSEGFAMVLKQFENLLSQYGVDEIAPEGELFDPNLHESVAHQPHDTVPEGHVSQVHRVGYRHRDRLMRPATVVVSSGPAAETTESSAEG